jgi:hypothetical protein
MYLLPVLAVAACANPAQEAAERAQMEQIVSLAIAECAQAGFQVGTAEHEACASLRAKQYDRMLNPAPDHSAALGMMMLGTTMMQQAQPYTLAPPSSPQTNCWSQPNADGTYYTFCR